MILVQVGALTKHDIFLFSGHTYFVVDDSFPSSDETCVLALRCDSALKLFCSNVYANVRLFSSDVMVYFGGEHFEG